MIHAPFARGVSHLSYVGDDEAIRAGEERRASMLSSPIFWLGAAAIGGGAIGMTKKQRKVSAVLAAALFLAL